MVRCCLVVGPLHPHSSTSFPNRHPRYAMLHNQRQAGSNGKPTSGEMELPASLCPGGLKGRRGKRGRTGQEKREGLDGWPFRVACGLVVFAGMRHSSTVESKVQIN